MNSLNVLSVVAPAPPLSASSPSVGATKENDRSPLVGHVHSGQSVAFSPEKKGVVAPERDDDTSTLDGADSSMEVDEQSPLLGESRPDHFGDVKASAWRSLPRRISSAVIGTVRVIITTISAPCRYVIACFYDEQGRFSPVRPFVTIYRVMRPRRKKRNAMAMPEKPEASPQGRGSKLQSQKRPKRPPSIASLSTAVASDSEMDEKMESLQTESQPEANSTRASTSPSASGEDITPARRSIRIKLHNDELLKRRRQPHETNIPENATKEDVKEAVAASLKSPPSPGVTKLTKFPRTPLPPRPLIPRRQPSYKNASANGPHQKTLIIDLDETLIHSHSKGGRFASGHMVEVRMQHAVGIGGTFIGPQIPILYYVHKRPHCDEFLKKVRSFHPRLQPSLCKPGFQMV
jgi:CTD nuclear envelope phosphatase 1